MPCGQSIPEKGLTAVSRVAFQQSGQPAAILYPFGHPTLYTYEKCNMLYNQPKCLLFSLDDFFSIQYKF
jgi:hypothetical protein